MRWNEITGKWIVLSLDESSASWHVKQARLWTQAGICKQSLKQIDQFGAQNLGNLAWALAKLLIEDAVLMMAISRTACQKMQSCGHQEIGASAEKNTSPRKTGDRSTQPYIEIMKSVFQKFSEISICCTYFVDRSMRSFKIRKWKKSCMSKLGSDLQLPRQHCMGLRYPVHSGSAFVGRDCRGGHPAHHTFQRAGHGQYSLGLGKGTIHWYCTVG